MEQDEHRRPSFAKFNGVDDGILRLDEKAIHRMSQVDSHVVDEFEEAKAAAENEHQLSVRDTFKLYPKAIGFSLIFSTAVIVSHSLIIRLVHQTLTKGRWKATICL
jgi:hypothetical protein